MKLFYPFIAVLIWSINAVVTKMAADIISPFIISFYRWLIAFAVLTPFVFVSVIKQRKVIYENWIKFFILGFLGMCLFQCLAYYAAQTITASFLGIANGVIPLLTLFLSLFILKVKPTLGLVIGGLLSFIGLSWIICDGNFNYFIDKGIGIGECLILGASLAYSLYCVLLKKWNIQVSLWASLYVQIFCGLICLLPLFLLSQNTTLTLESLPLVLYAAIPASIIAPVLWILGIRTLSANTCTIFLNLAPVFIAIIAFFYPGEALNLNFVIGGILVVIGVFIAQFLRKKIA